MCFNSFSTGIAGTFNAANLAKTDLLEKYPDYEIVNLDENDLPNYQVVKESNTVANIYEENIPSRKKENNEI